MRRVLGLGLAGATLALVLELTLTSTGHRVALAVYVLTVAAVVLSTLARAVRDSIPPARRSLFDPVPTHDEPSTPVQFADLEQRLTVAGDSEFEFETRLRPLLFQAAASRLARRYGIDLEARPAKARELLGEEAWELLRPDLRSERLAGRRRGLPTRKLRLLIEAVERL